MKNTINIVLFLLLAAVGKAQNLSSPDGNLLLKTGVERGIPYYELSYKGKAVLAPSRLGLDIEAQTGTYKLTLNTSELENVTLTAEKL